MRLIVRPDPTYPEWSESFTKLAVDGIVNGRFAAWDLPYDALSIQGEQRKTALIRAVNLLKEYHATAHEVYELNAALKDGIERQKQEIQQLQADCETFSRAVTNEQRWREELIGLRALEQRASVEQADRIEYQLEEITRLRDQVAALARIAAQTTQVLVKELTDEPETTS